MVHGMYRDSRNIFGRWISGKMLKFGHHQEIDKTFLLDFLRKVANLLSEVHTVWPLKIRAKPRRWGRPAVIRQVVDLYGSASGLLKCPSK